MPNSIDLKTYQTKDLVLKVSQTVDRKKWNEDKYEIFLDVLCEGREYQKQAIYTALRYVLGGAYNDLHSLAEENWEHNAVLQDRHSSFQSLEKRLQLPHQLSATVDLATGTGKSYVIYAIALILLAEGAVDSVLVLCPSTTIEDGLLSKFRQLAGRSDLNDLLPESSRLTVPKIIRADETITQGSICIENRDAVYQHVNSSIHDSLVGKGERVAVLNDEAHHVANDAKTKVKKWKEFLSDPQYGFRIVLGFSGTCYVKDEYFSDVIYRFSLREAMEQNYVKQVKYVAEQATTGEDDEQWQLIHSRHEDNRKKLTPKAIRPLTIVVTQTIEKCKEVGEELREFLVERTGLTEEEAKRRVIVVHTGAPDLAKLRNIDDPASPVEWIISVSMLTEGWDVKRVFQIVPHEERAFSSKLLIAQVLGRGLRVPENWGGGRPPEVTVFNHSNWASGIRHLVNEVLENERRLTSQAASDSPYHFDLHNLNYQMEAHTEQKTSGNHNALLDGKMELFAEHDMVEVNIDFEKAGSTSRESWRTQVRRRTYSAEEVAQKLHHQLQLWDLEEQGHPDPSQHKPYAKRYPYNMLLSFVKASLGDQERCVERNLNRLLSALNGVRPGGSKAVRYNFTPKDFQAFNTRSRPQDGVSASQLRQEKVVFCTPSTRQTLPAEQLELFDEVSDQGSAYRCFIVKNAYDFKTPLNLVIADSNPEYRFLKELVGSENAGKVDAWIKSTPQKFYEISYSWHKGEAPKRGTFNPDFFIKVDDLILVLEIKDDGELNDPSLENRGKNKAAIMHFKMLNKRLEQQGVSTRYQFHFLVPSNFPDFFKFLREGKLTTYRSGLDIKFSDQNADL